MGRCPGALVGNHRRIALDVPPVLRWSRTCAELIGHLEVSRGGRHPVEERAPRLRRLLPVEPLAHHGKLQRVVRADRALIVPHAAPKNCGSSWVRSVRRVTTPQLPPPPPLSAQKRSGCEQLLTTSARPSAVTTSASSSPAAAVPKALEKLPKPPLCTRPATPTLVQPPPCT